MDDYGGEFPSEARGVGSVDDLFARYYDELREAARRHLRRERAGHTLQTTALVHETFLRLRGHRGPFAGRTHFLAFAATAMRRVLVGHARERMARKRGGRPVRVGLHDDLAAPGAHLVDLLAVDEALDALAAHSPRKSRVAEMRLFAGMSVEETSVAVGVSARTVKDDWRFARAWIARRLRGATEPAS